MKQSNREELLDLGRGTPAEVRRSLRDIRRINTYLGGARVVCEGVFHLIEKQHLRRATILDIGTGSADIPARLVQQGARRGIQVQVAALDVSWRHLQVARAEVQGAPGISLLQADAFRLPLRDASIDIVISSLFLHHFRAGQIRALLREFDRVSRLGWVMNDLVRGLVPLVFFRTTWPIFARSYITRHDGAASIRRAYSTMEMRNIVAAAGLPGARVRGHFPYRLSIVRENTTP